MGIVRVLARLTATSRRGRRRAVPALVVSGLLGSLAVAALPQAAVAAPVAAAVVADQGKYVPLANPVRVLSGQPIGQNAEAKFTAASVGGLPASGASAVQMQVSLAPPAGDSGTLTLWPTGATRPTNTPNFT